MEKSLGLPTHLLIEPTNRCNLHCVFCPTGKGIKRPIGNMPIDLFKKLIDEIGDTVFLIFLWDWGEPFLNPDIYTMISYAKKKHIEVISSTNGHHFTQKKTAIQLVQSGIDSVIFAVDGLTQNTYQNYRKGGDLQKVIKSIEQVANVKKELKTSKPIINFRFIAMKHNEHEIPKLKSFTSSLGVDILTIRTLNPYINITENEYKSFLPKNPNFRRFHTDLNNTDPMKFRKNPCKVLWETPAIHWDGTVTSCTFDAFEDNPLGNVSKQTFRRIWADKPYKTLRKQFKKDYSQLPLCVNCTNAFKGGTCNLNTIKIEL